MSIIVETSSRDGPAWLGVAACPGCGRALGGRARCDACGRDYPMVDGLVEAIDPLTGRNAVAAAFYDGPGWARFEHWEKRFLALVGPGEAAARRSFLRHLPDHATARVLEVGIGDGPNVSRLPEAWEVFGVDIARSRLRACLARHPKTAGRLVWAEAEALPFADQTFDAVLTVGGINYFRDPARALAEMTRVAKPGATLIAADERPDLHRYGIGHLLGWPRLDARWMRWLTGLTPDFIDMVHQTPALVEPAARATWPGHRRLSIWKRLGYCLAAVREE